MKLLTKYNRVNIITTVIVLLISAICYYFLITSVLINQLDKDLKIEEQEVKDFIIENNQLPDPTNYKDEQEEFLPTTNEKVKRRFSSMDIFNKEHHENVAYRQLEFPLLFSGKQYRILIRKSEEETDDLIRFILTITLGILVILLITLFFINRFFLNQLWKPFNITLEQVKQFNLSGKEKVLLPQSDITEFTELNNAVNIMTSRAIQDYNEIKSFTENASHEIQTPLAIIKSKLELLSQTENLKEEQMNTIQSGYEAANRLSKLNQSLILLTKIDNQQFRESEDVDVSLLLNGQLSNYEELISAKSITVKKNIPDKIIMNMNEALAEILISNLITNAIKHNIDSGTIEINLTGTGLSVSNTGMPLESLPSELFERFKKDKVSSESLGLGLSIVKKICERYCYHVNYNYSDPLHTTRINF
ncbi:MAG TPA: HAMP domain-containing sensor histidine kinase [Chitinophagaceae bacterium]|nr:HAMP domain-containing sensor histidine kinase [Chitinophagaceae bacterium]